MRKKIRVLGRTWGVYRTPVNTAMGHKNVGLCSTYEQTLYVADGHPEEMDVIFLHELFHAMLEPASVSLEDDTISTIAALLYSVLKDNGWLKDHFIDWKKMPVFIGRIRPEVSGDKICSAEKWENMKDIEYTGTKRVRRPSRSTKRQETEKEDEGLGTLSEKDPKNN